MTPALDLAWSESTGWIAHPELGRTLIGPRATVCHVLEDAPAEEGYTPPVYDKHVYEARYRAKHAVMVNCAVCGKAVKRPKNRVEWARRNGRQFACPGKCQYELRSGRHSGRGDR